MITNIIESPDPVSLPFALTTQSQVLASISNPEIKIQHTKLHLRRSSFTHIKPPAEVTRSATYPEEALTEQRPQHFRRHSSFIETGLADSDRIVGAKIRRSCRPPLRVRFHSRVEVLEPDPPIDWPEPDEEQDDIMMMQRHRQMWDRHYRVMISPEPPATFPTLPRILFLILVLGLLIPSLNGTGKSREILLNTGGLDNPVTSAKIVPVNKRSREIFHSLLSYRDLKFEIEPSIFTVPFVDNPSDVCSIWSQHTPNVNGTL